MPLSHPHNYLTHHTHVHNCHTHLTAIHTHPTTSVSDSSCFTWRLQSWRGRAKIILCYLHLSFIRVHGESRCLVTKVMLPKWYTKWWTRFSFTLHSSLPLETFKFPVKWEVSQPNTLSTLPFAPTQGAVGVFWEDQWVGQELVKKLGAKISCDKILYCDFLTKL